ncbi:MAG: amidohydrolase, partial [Gammaproteobacteria bacterium]
AGTDNNVIPDRALLKINLRWFHPNVREQMITGIRSINTSIAKAYGLPDDMMPTMTMKGASTPLINDASLIEQLNVPLKSLLGDKQVVTEFPPATGSEDAHLLTGDNAKIRVAYLNVGIAEPAVFAQARKEGKSVPFANHNGNYQVDLAAIPLGIKVATTSVLELLVKGPAR